MNKAIGELEGSPQKVSFIVTENCFVYTSKQNLKFLMEMQSNLIS